MKYRLKYLGKKKKYIFSSKRPGRRTFWTFALIENIWDQVLKLELSISIGKCAHWTPRASSQELPQNTGLWPLRHMSQLEFCLTQHWPHQTGKRKHDSVSSCLCWCPKGIYSLIYERGPLPNAWGSPTEWHPEAGAMPDILYPCSTSFCWIILTSMSLLTQ